MTIETEAIILKSQKYRETDEILTLYTKKYGKVKVFSKSSKKLKNRLSSGTQLFSHNNMQIELKENGSILLTSELKKNYYKFSENLSKYYLVSYICELVEKTQQDNITDINLFNLIIKFFNLIENNKINLKLLRLIFELLFIKCLGIQPQLDSCNICKSMDVNYLKYLDFNEGCLICETCLSFQNNHLIKKLDKNLIRFIKYVYNNSIEKSLDVKIANLLLIQLDELLQEYFVYYFGNLKINSYPILLEEEKLNDNFRKN